MDFLKAQFTRLQAQLAGLTPSQKMLTVTLVAIMVATMYGWSRWAAEPELQPILNQSISADDMELVVDNLDAKGISHKIVGDRVMIPADRRLEALASLSYSHLLPRNFDGAFDDMIKQMGLFTSSDQADRMYLEARMRTLSKVLSSFPGVANAIVLIDSTSERRFDGTAVQPAASINLSTLRGDGADARRLAEAAADLVSGAQAGLLRSHINVVVDGVPVVVKDHDDMTADGSVVDAIKKVEDYYRDKIMTQYAFIPGLKVSVTANLVTSDRQVKKHTVDPKGTVAIPMTNEENSTETTAPEPASASEPGAQPNVSASVAPSASGGGGGGSNTSDSKTQNSVDHSTEDEVLHQGPGVATVLAASVRVPESYFVAALKRKNNDKDPDDAALNAFTTEELARIKQDVKADTGIATDDAVVVAPYSDAMLAIATGNGAPAGAAGAGGGFNAQSFTSAVTDHIKELGVGLLAAVSLFMMTMMVKKSSPAPAVVKNVAQEGEPETLQVGDGIIGQVGEGNTALDAMELDEESVRAQQMLDQVEQMVQTNPEAAASLVKRWLNRT